MIFDALRRWMGSGSGGNGTGGEKSPPLPAVCENALSRLYEFLDGELDELTREEVEAHFEVCKRCYPQLACERSFRRALERAMKQERAPADLRHRILGLLEAEQSEGEG
jgi:anti-sigma factor (TIGR02949 family)